jgi:alkylated DNA repair protein (DNA oxidative demethylase)
MTRLSRRRVSVIIEATMLSADLFDTPRDCRLGTGIVLLKAFALPAAASLLAEVRRVAAAAPFRQMSTPGGFRMSVAMTNCGAAGWITDRRGYRYSAVDPDSSKPWPALPTAILELALGAAEAAGFAGFAPDACLINRYAPGARMSLHQDSNERNRDAPIVSISLGLPATFLFGGQERRERPQRLSLQHGDVLVWGGAARMNFHGVAPLADGSHPELGRERISLTLRHAL